MAKFSSPDFPNAPLIEVALSVQFQPLPLYTSAHAGEFWQKIRDDFPVTQEQPPIPQVNEFFGSNRPSPGFIDIGLNFGLTGLRSWFMSEDGGFLIQIQRNRFVLNWRKTGPNPTYPRYEPIRKMFLHGVAQEGGC